MVLPSEWPINQPILGLHHDMSIS